MRAKIIVAAVVLFGTASCTSILPMLAPGVEFEEGISAEFPYESKFVNVHGSKMHYVEKGEGNPIVLVHGNPTSSYLWRNVIPHLSSMGRVIAPDNIGMGKSDKPDLAYQLEDHVKYFEGFINALELKNVTLVLHDWGGGIGFDYAMRNQKNVRAIAFMEALVKPMSLEKADAPTAYLFGKLRDKETGDQLMIEENYFVEKLIPMFAGRAMSEAEMTAYRAPYLEAKHRKPIAQWPREIPFDGKPARTQTMISATYDKLKSSKVPLLLLVAEPGAIMNEDFVSTLKKELPRMETKNIGPGMHYVQETQPTNIGKAIAAWIPKLPAVESPAVAADMTKPDAGKNK